MALSMMSSEDDYHLHNSLHEATVQMAYTKIIGRFDHMDKKRESEAVSGVIAEESECGEGSESEGCSAIDALEDAARRIAVER